jgi:hypothetical protein
MGRRSGVLGAIALALLIWAGSARAQMVYANAKLADPAQNYLFALCYQWQGAAGGDVWLGDLGGLNLLHGIPTSLSFPAADRGHIEGVGSWNGLAAAFFVDLVGSDSVTYRVEIAGVPVWAGGSVFEWAGIYLAR